MTNRCRAALMFAGLALTGTVFAEESAAPNAQILGTTEAILQKCAEIDAAHADQYRSRVKLVAGDATEKVLADVRASDAYRQAYDTARESLDSKAAPDALKACKGSLAPGQ